MVRDAARTTDCAARERQIGLAFSAYAGDWEGRLPYPFSSSGLGCWNQRLSIDYDDGRTLGIFKEPLFKQAPGYTASSLTGYGMNTRLPPSLISTANNVAQDVSASLGRIKQPSLAAAPPDTAADRRAQSRECRVAPRPHGSGIYGGMPGGPTPLYLNVVRHRPQTSEPYVTWALLPGKTNHDPSHFAAITLDLPLQPATATVATAAPGHLTLTSRLDVPEVLLGATPVRLVTGAGRFALPTTLRITDRAGIDPGVLADIQAVAQVAGAGTAELTLAIAPAVLDDPALDAAQRARLASPEAFRLELAGATATISGRSQAGVLRGLATLAVMTERARISAHDLPDLVLLDAPASLVRGWLLHDSKPITVTRQSIDVAFRLRLNCLLIAVDSFNSSTGFPFTSAPIGDPARTTQEWIDAFTYARARGIDPIPYISSWARVQYITRLPQYRHLMVSDRGIVQSDYRNLDVANPEAQRLMLALQED